MKVMVWGGGGREHALVWRIQQSPLVREVHVTHHNPGFVGCQVVEGDPIAQAQHLGIDLVVVGPEAPLADGAADQLRDRGIAVFGPSQKAAQLEASKAFSKDFMAKHDIPTAAYSVHDDRSAAHAAVEGLMVVKADGLAAGKGVVVADSEDEAHQAIDAAFDGAYGDAGARVVLEERLEGPEVSVLSICDGQRQVFLPPCRDHKRRFAADQGPNTGGMGAICPPADVDDAMLDEIHRGVHRRVVAGMAEAGTPFVGVLYAGLMLTPDGPKVLEFNVRFGDPECQPLMMRLNEDLVPIMMAAAQGRLEERALSLHPGVAAAVVVVAGGYPGPYPKGMEITGLGQDTPESMIFFAGAKQEDDKVVANGGRVLAATAVGERLSQALDGAYARAGAVQFDGAAFRRDIGRC